jgi:hypothetical protein
VQLVHDHALSAVNDERTGRRHHRQVAHVNFLLAHFAGFDGDQANRRLKRCGVGQTVNFAIPDVTLWLAQRVLDKFEHDITV